MSWSVVLTETAEAWVLSLDEGDYNSIAAAIDMLVESGPALTRPIVDTIKGSRHKNMKELRSVGGNLRALFAFDPQREAIILLGGDKTGNWTGWYETNIPLADDHYDDHLKNLKT